MTKKEKLLVAYYQISNQIDVLDGEEERFDIEEMTKTGFLSAEAKRKTEMYLESKLQNVEKVLKRKQREAARNEYLKTDEGKAAFVAIQSKREILASKIDELEVVATRKANEILAEHVSTRLKVRMLHSGVAEIGLVPGHQFSSFDVYFGRRSGGDDKFEVSCGSTGSFDLNNERAEFYVCLGKFLSTPACNEIRSLFLEHALKMNDIENALHVLYEEDSNLGIK